ncbi:hypothetical protein BDV23DRAFT_176994 [Aspergillus alliaceus]|uniref:Uncharacterized protein n=1 Tax=Petromyces alliaceus TaxID=209559 RepID=A0A5N7BSL0_PETAA|nr:hypothetical protein BDV23DRAFT_176994 [Aspergillus alliaceus]
MAKQITALSQGAINTAMAKLVKDHPEIGHVQSKSKTGDTLDAEIGQPLGSLKFKSGKLLFSYDPPEDFDGTEWTVALNVEIDSVKVEPGSDEDKKVRNPNDIVILAGILARWYVNDGPMTDRQKRTIGYGLQASDPSSMNKQAPNFPPTLTKKNLEEKDFPSAPILPYTGKFVSKGMGGTMCIEKDILWDRCLLRTTTPQLLHLFNNATYAWEKVMEWIWGLPSQPEQSVSKADRQGNTSGSIDVTCTTSNSMKTASGSNVITGAGETDIDVHVTCCETSVWALWSCDYTIIITLNAVDDGAYFQVSSHPLKYRMEGGLWPTKDDVEGQQINNLNSSARFVVPGQGTFRYSNPMFNDNGDLLIKVDYKE